jgi:FTR1 family protein
VLPTFVIGLREGIEASLIVGIVAAFLRREGRADTLRLMWIGVGAAVTLCVAAAVALQVLDRELPAQQQEGLETVVAAAAVAMVTFMIVWMRRHARGLAGELRSSAASALATGSAWALVAMAFLAVVREGLETAVFLLAAFQASGDSVSAGGGALAGIAVAVAVGWMVARGTRLNLGRFFELTALALALVAAGLVMSAVHTAHEAGWWNSLQGQAVSLGWLVRPGTISSSLLTGVLGLQPQPNVGEAVGWLLYLVPVLLFLLWPRLARMTVRTGAVLTLLVLALLAAGCGASSPPGGQTLKVTLTDGGCSPSSLKAKSGTITFEVSNGGTSKVSELEVKRQDGVVLGEKENVVDGIKGGFTLVLQPGTYVLSCPNGGGNKDGELVVGGKRVAAGRTLPQAKINAALTGYRLYVAHQVALLAKGTNELAAALEAGDLAKAKALYGPVRSHYEAIEPVAESFGNLDPKLDARKNDVAPGTPWTGFHHIEQILWQQNTTEGTVPLAKQLRLDVGTLRRKVGNLFFEPAQLANGAVELLDEVAHSKITGEEDRYSHTDLSDFQANLTGSRKAFELLKPALVAEGDGALAATIERRFDDVQNGLDRYRRPTPLGFALYSSLTPADRRAFAQQIDALAEPLSTVAAKVSP